jgi:hypothetical protein
LLLKANAASAASKTLLCVVAANDLPTRRFVLFSISVGALYFFVSKACEGRCAITGCYSTAVVVDVVATRRTLRWTKRSHGVGEFGEDEKVTTKTTARMRAK